MISGMFHDDEDSVTSVAEVAQEAPAGVGVDAALGFGDDQLSIPKAHRAKVADHLACRDGAVNPHSCMLSFPRFQ
mgnify:FL=1